MSSNHKSSGRHRDGALSFFVTHFIFHTTRCAFRATRAKLRIPRFALLYHVAVKYLVIAVDFYIHLIGAYFIDAAFIAVDGEVGFVFGYLAIA